MTNRPPKLLPGAAPSIARVRKAKDRRQHDRARGSAAKRGYDSQWRKLRKAFLAAHPLCECDECRGGEGGIVPADVVDHIIPISERPDLRLEWSNLRAMSKPHHDRHTAKTQGFAKGGG